MADPLRLCTDVGAVVDRAAVGQVGHHRPASSRVCLPLFAGTHPQLAEECPSCCLCSAGKTNPY